MRRGCSADRAAARCGWESAGTSRALRALVARAETAVVAAGLPGERRELRPHLTIARVRRQARAAERRAIAASVRALAAPEGAPFVAGELVLVHSRLRPDGPRYERLAGF